MGLGDLMHYAMGSTTPTVQDANYDRAVSPEALAAQQETAQRSIGQGQGNLGAAAAGYQGTMAGAAPSLAQMQMKQGQQAATQQAQGMAASARGTGNQLLAQQQAGQQQALASQQNNAQAGMLRAQEVQGATQGLAGIGAQQQNLGQQYGIGSQGQNMQEQQFATNTRVGVAQGNQKAQSEENRASGSMVSGLLGAICCSPDTLILTPSGERRIESIEAGDLVYTVGHRMAKVLRATSTAVTDHRVMRVVLASGSVLEISPWHPTADGRIFGDLHTGDVIDGVRVECAELVPYGHGRTFDILPDDPSGTYYAGGVRIGSTLRGL